VDSFEDWVERRAAILANLTEDWFRFTDGPVDPKHPGRAGVLPAWSDVRLAFADWAGDAVEVELTPVPRSEAKVEQPCKQYYGLGMNLMVLLKRKANSLDAYLHLSPIECPLANSISIFQMISAIPACDAYWRKSKIICTSA
jgi:hypothetical protein